MPDDCRADPSSVLTPVVRLFAAWTAGFPAHPSRTDNRPS